MGRERERERARRGFMGTLFLMGARRFSLVALAPHSNVAAAAAANESLNCLALKAEVR